MDESGPEKARFQPRGPREHGIRQAQGFVFAPPLPGPAFLELLEAMEPVSKEAAVASRIAEMKQAAADAA